MRRKTVDHMEKLTLRIKADYNGNYKTIDVLKQIKTSCKAVIFPIKPLEKTCLADLRMNGKNAIRGITEGIPETWNNNTMEYMERDLTLFFG